MKNLYTMEEYGSKPGIRTLYTFEEKNNKGESLTVEISEVYPDNKSKSSLPNLWFKSGFIDRVLNNYLVVNNCVTDAEGNGWDRYNPQRIKHQCKINFAWMLEVSEENKNRLLSEIYRQFTAEEN